MASSNTRRLRLASAYPVALLGGGLLLLAQSQPTCIPQDLGAEATSTPAIQNQTGRELTAAELDQIIANGAGDRVTVVFLNPSPGLAGPPGKDGAEGAPGPIGPAGQPAASLIGEVNLWAGPFNAPPAGWLACDGSIVARARYPQLFAVIGEKFGAGDRATTFQLPDFRDRSPMGASAFTANGALATQVEGSPASLGGAPEHTLTLLEMPTHDHDMTHTHDIATGFSGSGSPVLIAGQDSAPSLTPTSGPSTQWTSTAGGGLPHSIVDPYFAISYLIYAGE